MSPENVVIEKPLRLDFSATNNEAEYETLLVGMAMVQKMGGKVHKTLLGLKACRQSSKRGIRGKRRKDAGVLESS